MPGPFRVEIWSCARECAQVTDASLPLYSPAPTLTLAIINSASCVTFASRIVDQKAIGELRNCQTGGTENKQQDEIKFRQKFHETFRRAETVAFLRADLWSWLGKCSPELDRLRYRLWGVKNLRFSTDSCRAKCEKG